VGGGNFTGSSHKINWEKSHVPWNGKVPTNSRDEIEQRLVDGVMKKVGCSRGLVRECLAELRGEEQMVFIETISKEILIKNSLTEFLCQSPFYSRDMVRYVFTIYDLF